MNERFVKPHLERKGSEEGNDGHHRAPKDDSNGEPAEDERKNEQRPLTAGRRDLPPKFHNPSLRAGTSVRLPPLAGSTTHSECRTDMSRERHFPSRATIASAAAPPNRSLP